MKRLKDHKEDLYKCSKCGLCQSVCPIYKATKNETLLARGRFVVLEAIADSKLEFTSSIKKNLDICLNCNVCKDFCPSSIDAKEIFLSAKSEIIKQNGLPFTKTYLFFKLKMQIFGLFAKLYRFFQMDKLIPVLTKIKYLPFRRYFQFANHLFSVKIKKNNVVSNIEKDKKVVFYEGCFNKYINPSSKNASMKLIKELGYSASLLKTECCSISLLCSGNVDEFKNNALKIVASVPNDVDYVVSDCDSCVSTLRKYSKYFVEAEEFSKKVISLADFLLLNNYSSVKGTNRSVTYHKPCHNESDCESLINNIENVEYAPLCSNSSCCGFGGEFGLKHTKISRQISLKKADDILSTGAEVVLTACPSCIMGLAQGLILKDSDREILNISEYLAGK